MTETNRHRYGDVRENGDVFICYRPSCRSGEYWVTPERFASLKLKAALRRNELKASKPKKPKRITIYTHPQLRVRPFKTRPFRQKRELTQKEFDTLPYGPKTISTMTTLQDMTIIPNYSKYAITPDGTVHRVQPATRGRTAGMLHRVTPVIHPKGHQWCVQITDDNGNRKRIPIKKLMEQVYGKAETIS
jgi:hypothetical protein